MELPLHPAIYVCMTLAPSMLPIITALACAALMTRAASAADAAVTVPLRLSSDYPIIDLEIGGHKIPVVFDLGEDSALVLTQAALDALKTIPTGPGYKVADPKGNVLESRTFKIASLRIGGTAFTDVPGRIDVHDASYDSAKVGQEGFIGPSLLRDYKFVLDYRRGRLTLIPAASALSENAGCRGTAVPFDLAWKGLPVTKAATDLGELTLIWDTGTPTSLIKDALLKARRPGPVQDSIVTQQFRLNGENFGPLALEAFEFSQPPGADGFVGTNFFAKHVVCVDLQGRRLLIR